MSDGVFIDIEVQDGKFERYRIGAAWADEVGQARITLRALARKASDEDVFIPIPIETAAELLRSLHKATERAKQMESVVKALPQWR